MFFFAHQRSQMVVSAEALTMPRVQVIVLNANMRCLQCRDRVSKVLSKIDYLLDYVVDVTQKKVTVRGRVCPRKRMDRIRLMANDKKRNDIEFQTFEGYPTDVGRQYCSSTPKKSIKNVIDRGCCFHYASSSQPQRVVDL